MKINITKFNIKHYEKVHLNNFYRALHDYLYDEEYLGQHSFFDDRNEDFPETYYYENRTQKKGNETWIWWRPEKYIFMYRSQFWKRRINLTFHCRAIKDVEMMHEGKKLHAQFGEIDLYVFVFFELDWKHEWHKNWLTNMFFEVFWRRIYNKTLEGHKKETLRDAYKLQEWIKNALKLYTFSVPRKIHMPQKGYPQVSEY